MTRGLVRTCACILFAAPPCLALDGGTAAANARREGFLIGFSLGTGGLSPNACCGLAVGTELHIGGAVSRSLAVLVQAGGVGTTDARHGGVVAAAQWWPNPDGRFWVKAGFGVGSYESDLERVPVDAYKDPNKYATVLGEGGVELARSGRFTVDLQLRALGTREPDRWTRSGALSVGFNWY